MAWLTHRVRGQHGQNGSRDQDLDIIVIAEDDVFKDALKDLDQAIFRKKHYLLVHPNYHEEIDYLVKDIAKVGQQLAFDSFQDHP